MVHALPGSGFERDAHDAALLLCRGFYPGTLVRMAKSSGRMGMDNVPHRWTWGSTGSCVSGKIRSVFCPGREVGRDSLQMRGTSRQLLG